MVPSRQPVTPGRGSNARQDPPGGHHLMLDSPPLSQFQGNSEDPALHNQACGSARLRGHHGDKELLSGCGAFSSPPHLGCSSRPWTTWDPLQALNLPGPAGTGFHLPLSLPKTQRPALTSANKNLIVPSPERVGEGSLRYSDRRKGFGYWEVEFEPGLSECPCPQCTWQGHLRATTGSRDPAGQEV